MIPTQVAPKVSPPAKVSASASVGTLSLFGLFAASRDAYDSLQPILVNVSSLGDLVTNFEKLDHLAQGGVFLYFGLEVVSLAGLGLAVVSVIRYHAYEARRHIGLKRRGHSLKQRGQK